MAEASRRAHWEEVYASRGETDVSWFQDNPKPSLELIEQVQGGHDGRIIDIGGGASRLADGLLERGFRDLTVLDISTAALDLAALRLGRRASEVQWITADMTEWHPSRRFDVWHDRAVFHFLVDPADRAAYVTRLRSALVPGGHAIIATFATDGPDTCSGLPVRRYDAALLATELGAEFLLVESRPHDHLTPWNSSQRFQFSVFQKQGGS
jgi:2-polyprenyl-3-methyl-5-hydroxy-6-metoxy-1,4-benzoquinol methylase